MTEPTDADRARLRAWLDRKPPQRFDAVGLVGPALLEHLVTHRPWRDFEPAPCVCHHGVVVVACEGGFRMVACARCGASQAATVAPGTTNGVQNGHDPGLSGKVQP